MVKEYYASIDELYANPILESSPICMNYINSSSQLDALKDARDAINDVVQKKRSELGFGSIRELNLLPSQAKALCDEIKRDPLWKESLTEIVASLSPDILEKTDFDFSSAITLPWWNAAVLGRVKDDYNGAKPSLSIDATVSHSYITQLTRSLNIPRQQGVDAMSISNVLVTKDDLIVLGLRGGHSYANTFMVVPAGSVEYHTGKNPLFETLYAEHFEETGLSKDQIRSAEFIGRIYDPQSKCSLYVSRSRIDLGFSELIDLWGSAIDNREHKFLIPIKDHPQETVNQIRSHMYHPEKSNPLSVSITTLDNVNTILPPAAASLLTHHAQYESGNWKDKAESLFDGAYVFRK